MEDSFNSMNLSSASSYREEKYGTRPELPEGLGPEYKKVIKIFMACTEADPDNRPSAADIVKVAKP